MPEFNRLTGRAVALAHELLHDPDLVLFLPLNEKAGTLYDRCLATRATAAATGSLTYSKAIGSGFYGIDFPNPPAAQFTAANSEYLSCADNAELSTGDVDFAICAWVYLDNKTNSQGIVTKWNVTGNQREFGLSYNVGVDRFAFNVSSTGANDTGMTASNSGSPTAATWYFLVVWHDAAGNTINIQVNNGTANSQAYSSGLFDSTGAFQIGGYVGGTYLDGRVTGVGFWKRVLTADERTTLYNGGIPLQYAELTDAMKTSMVSWWELSEASGDRADSHGTNTLTDTNTVTQAARPGRYLSLGDVAALSFDLDDAFSALAIVDPTVTLVGSILSKWDSANARGWDWQIDGDRKPHVILQNTASTNLIDVIANAALTNGTDVMLGFSYDGSEAASGVTLYRNGAADADTDTTDTLDATIDHDSAAQIGARAGSQPFNGDIAFIAVFNAVKTAAEFRRYAAIGGFL